MELTTLLDKLKLEYLDAQLDAVCEQAAERDLDYKSFLAQALDVERTQNVVLLGPPGVG